MLYELALHKYAAARRRRYRAPRAMRPRLPRPKTLGGQVFKFLSQPKAALYWDLPGAALAYGLPLALAGSPVGAAVATAAGALGGYGARKLVYPHLAKKPDELWLLRTLGVLTAAGLGARLAGNLASVPFLVKKLITTV